MNVEKFDELCKQMEKELDRLEKVKGLQNETRTK